MDRYAAIYGCLADMVWREEYKNTEEAWKETLLSQQSG